MMTPTSGQLLGGLSLFTEWGGDEHFFNKSWIFRDPPIGSTIFATLPSEALSIKQIFRDQLINKFASDWYFEKKNPIQHLSYKGY